MPDSLLVIIDVQQGFINQWTRHIPKAVETLQREYSYVIATKFINPDPSPFRQFIGWTRFAPDNVADTDLAFAPKEDSLVVEKTIYSAAPNIIALSKEKQINDVTLCGIATDNCVLKTAVDLFESSIRPIILADYCASHGGPEAHNAGLLLLRRMVGSDQVITTNPC